MSPLIREDTVGTPMVEVGARVWGPDPSMPGVDRTILLAAPGDRIPRAEAERLGLLSGDYAKGVRVDEVPVDPSQAWGHRDQLAAERLADVQNSPSEAKRTAEAAALRAQAEAVTKESRQRAAARPGAGLEASQQAFAEKATEVEAAARAANAKSGPELAAALGIDEGPREDEAPVEPSTDAPADKVRTAKKSAPKS